MVSIRVMIAAVHKILTVTDMTITSFVIFRPCYESARVHPSALCNYRASYEMLGPCCLCPMAEGNVQDYVEAAIYQATSGPFSGEYVASCARDRCGYFGGSFLAFEFHDVIHNLKFQCGWSAYIPSEGFRSNDILNEVGQRYIRF
jgi:hypothetical protein